MSNYVETFNKFNQGMRRPDRRRHLELCGFTLTRLVNPEGGKPAALALEHVNNLSIAHKCFFQGVTLPRKDSDGWTYYEVWTKKLTPTLEYKNA